MRAEIGRLGLQTAVKLPGFVEGVEKACLLESSAVFVLPSKQENFGNAVAEAMDAGLPVVITRNVDIWSEVEAAGAGIVIGERTPGELAKALNRLLGDPGLREQMGQKGRELVRSAFDPASVGPRLQRLYYEASGTAWREAAAAPRVSGGDRSVPG